MKKNSLFILHSLFFIFGTIHAYYSCDTCGPLQPCRWYIMPKVGAAPGLFANRGHELRVVPKSGVTCPLSCADFCSSGESIIDCTAVLTAPQNILQQDCCRIPKFDKLFTNKILHVGGEIGYITDVHCMYFLDLIYNRATGSCVCSQLRNIKAIDGCCSSDCRDCDNILSEEQRTLELDDYSSFAAYIGNRYFFNRMLCNRVSFFLGLKTGFMHRRKICVCMTIPEIQDDQGVVIFPERTLQNIAFCQSNAVSGGIQLGFDLCISDSFAFMIGFEIVATCPFKANRNISIDLPQPTEAEIDTLAFANPTNIIVGSTGSFVQFPIWAGLRWKWECRYQCDE